jgi:hypothetical protein
MIEQKENTTNLPIAMLLVYSIRIINLNDIFLLNILYIYHILFRQIVSLLSKASLCLL